jgi:hypothetical protein
MAWAPAPTLELGLRGKAMRAEVPLLISTAEYGEYHPGFGSYRFDFTAPGRYRITAPGIDYYFYYGPTPKGDSRGAQCRAPGGGGVASL